MTGPLEPREGWTAVGCTIAKSLELLSTRSAFLLLREAFYGTTRFQDFAERVGISEPAAAERLRDLVENGLLAREEYQVPGQRTRQRYVLTVKGADLLPVLLALTQWGDRWTTDRGGPVQFRHRACGQQVRAEVRCADGHEVDLGQLDLAARPGLRL